MHCHSFSPEDQHMIHCHNVEPGTTEHSDKPIDDTITLDETDRHRRRYRMTSDNGIEFLLELESARLLTDNDVLLLTDGKRIGVRAKPEALYAVSGRDATHLLHLTWHVGNRHLATQVLPDHILIRRDPVIRRMLSELGATVDDVTAGFNPLGGAYGEAPAHAHSHAHAHEHKHTRES